VPSMTQQTEYPTSKPGDRCRRCGKGALVLSPSGMNLHCDTCNKITVLPQVQRTDDRPVGSGHRRTRGRPTGTIKKRGIRRASVPR
jgi:hypothetical protein